MKKILVVFSGAEFAYHVLEQAITVAAGHEALLLGVFLRPPTPTETTYPFINSLAIAGDEYYSEVASMSNLAVLKSSISLFNSTCEANRVNHAIHLEDGTPLHMLPEESVFADLIVIDAKAGLYGNDASLLPPSLRGILADSHCPVLLVHDKAQPVESAVLTYDGSASSMHAIKMFSYLFPGLASKPTCLVSVNEGAGHDLMHSSSVKNWLYLHFTNLQIDVLNGNAKNALATYINSKPAQTLVVMGAYGRNAMSRLLRQSLANYIISHTTMPLFITHE